MRHMILTGFLMIAAGVCGFVEGRDWTQSLHVPDVAESGQPHVVFAKSGTRQQKEVREQSEGCPVVPNGEFSKPQSNRQDITTQGLVF